MSSMTVSIRDVAAAGALVCFVAGMGAFAELVARLV